MKIQPLHDRILVKPEQQETKTKSGIYLPEDDSKIKKGEVIAVGDHEDIRVKVGDKVIYESYSGTELEVDNEKFVLLKARDVLAKIE